MRRFFLFMDERTPVKEAIRIRAEVSPNLWLDPSKRFFWGVYLIIIESGGVHKSCTEIKLSKHGHMIQGILFECVTSANECREN